MSYEINLKSTIIHNLKVKWFALLWKYSNALAIFNHFLYSIGLRAIIIHVGAFKLNKSGIQSVVELTRTFPAREVASSAGCLRQCCHPVQCNYRADSLGNFIPFSMHAMQLPSYFLWRVKRGFLLLFFTSFYST